MSLVLNGYFWNLQSFISGTAIYAYLSLHRWCDLWVSPYRWLVRNLPKFLFPPGSSAKVTTATSLLSTHSAWLTYVSPCLEVISSFKMVMQIPSCSHLIHKIDLQLACFLQHIVWQCLNTHKMQQPLSYQLSITIWPLSLFTNSFASPQSPA